MSKEDNIKVDEIVDVPTDYKALSTELQTKLSNAENTIKVYEEHYNKLLENYKQLEKLVKQYDSCITGIVSFIKLLDTQMNEKENK